MCLNLGQKYHSKQRIDSYMQLPNKLSGADQNNSRCISVRIGEFHTLSCFIAAIGKLWGDGGLRDLLVASNVYAGSTADFLLAGKQFHQQ